MWRRSHWTTSPTLLSETYSLLFWILWNNYCHAFQQWTPLLYELLRVYIHVHIASTHVSGVCLYADCLHSLSSDVAACGGSLKATLSLFALATVRLCPSTKVIVCVWDTLHWALGRPTHIIVVFKPPELYFKLKNKIPNSPRIPNLTEKGINDTQVKFSTRTIKMYSWILRFNSI